MGYWAPYVPVATRRARAEKYIKKEKKKGKDLNPVRVSGRQIAHTFWGKAWCDNLESYSDYENRLPRGRTYVRNSSVIDLQISEGQVLAQVMGSSLYKVTITIKAMSTSKWTGLVKACSGKIDSLIELLQGQFSNAVMSIIIERDCGLFPCPSEIKMRCSCPDWAGMCKHTAATLYGVGAFLDQQPEKLFLLRDVDHLELTAQAGRDGILGITQPSAGALEENDLSTLFGIEMAPDAEFQESVNVAAVPPRAKRGSRSKPKKRRSRKDAS